MYTSLERDVHILMGACCFRIADAHASPDSVRTVRRHDAGRYSHSDLLATLGQGARRASTRHNHLLGLQSEPGDLDPLASVSPLHVVMTVLAQPGHQPD